MAGIDTKIKKLMQSLGISQKQLSDGLGLNKSYVADLVNGRRVNFEMKKLKAMCRFFKVSPNELLPWEEWGAAKRSGTGPSALRGPQRPK